MTCAELQERSLALVTLPDGDADRAEADNHARCCDACTDALAEARAILQLLDRHGAPAPPSEAALRRARAHIAADMRGAGGAGRVLPALAAAAGFVLVALLAKHRVTDPIALALAGLGLAAAALRAAGMPWRSWLGLGVTLVASAVFAAVVGGPGELDATVGVKCVLLEAVAGSLPLATTAFLLWRRQAPYGAMVFACAAAAGALAGHAALHLTCPRRLELPHLFAFHVAGVALAALIGALVSLPFRHRLH